MTRWGSKELRTKRDKLITELYKKGYTVQQIAPQVRLCVERVYQILEKQEQGLELRPEIRDRLEQSSNLPRASLISIDEMRRRLKLQI